MLCRIVIVLFLVSLEYRTFAQSPVTGIDKTHGTYHSDVDELLTIERVSVLPFTDNLQGIYARPLEAHFISLVDHMHRWNYIAPGNTGPILSPEELEASPEKTLQATQGLGVDAVFAGRITKGPNGIAVHLSLFLTKDGKLLSQAILKEYKQFDLPDLKEQTQRLLGEIVQRLPYSGRVLSREVNRVTVNLGSKDGIQPGQILSVIQIIQTQRHPKFNFLVHTDKEIFGKIRILKVDETLSFGTVVSEKERGAIQKNSKIGPVDLVTYPGGDSLSLTPGPSDALAGREDGKVAFGKDPKAWVPSATPTFGQIGGRIGLGRVDEAIELSGVGALNSTKDLAPSVQIDGEIWITPEWTFYARIVQAIIQVNNPRAGSNPDKLNQQYSDYEAGFGYMFRFGPYVWSPNLQPFLGYFTSRLYSDDTSPQTYTTTNYNGFKMGLRGSTPVSADGEWGAGGEFAFAVKAGLSEAPYSSGSSSSNGFMQLGVFGYKKIGERLKAVAGLDFAQYSSSFSGSGTRAEPATSASQRFTTLSGGVYFMF